MRLDPLQHVLRYGRDVRLRRHVRRDDDLAQPVVPSDRARRGREHRVGQLSQRHGLAGSGRDEHLVERAEFLACLHGQSHRDVELVAVGLAELADVEAGDCGADRAVDFDRSHAEQGRLVGVDVELEVGAQAPRGVVDVARARRGRDDRLGLVRQPLQLVEVGADHRDLDGCVDRRPVAVGLDDDPRTGVRVELRPQFVEHGRRAPRVEFLELDEHLARVGLRLLGEDVVVHTRIAAADVREPVTDLRVLAQFRLDEVHGPIGVRDARAGRRLDLDPELRDVGAREQAEAEGGRDAERPKHERQRGEQRLLRPGERPAQRGRVHAVDEAHDRLQRPVARVLTFAGRDLEHAAREEGDDGERDEERREHRGEHRDRERPDELAGPPGRKSSGTKAKDSVAVQPTTATAIWWVAAMAASMRERPARRKREMFSTTTIESSTRRPRASTTPTIESWLSEEPLKRSSREADGERERDGDHHDRGRAEAEREAASPARA